jgi:hypothetical protein
MGYNMRQIAVSLLLLSSAALLSFGAEKYNGPRPAKADVPYLMHADTLIETEVGEAREQSKKDTTIAVLPGASSPAKTPLAEPIFIIRAEKLVPERLSAFKMEVKNGNREVTVSQKKGRNAQRPIYLNVTRLGDNLYKVEVDQGLENGQYTLSPEGSNLTFSFEVY